MYTVNSTLALGESGGVLGSVCKFDGAGRGIARRRERVCGGGGGCARARSKEIEEKVLALQGIGGPRLTTAFEPSISVAMRGNG